MHSNRVCLLSHAEHKAFVHWNRRPNCRHHQHITRAKADELVRHGDLRYVSQPGPRRTFFAVQYTWQKTYKREGVAEIHATANNGRRTQMGPGLAQMQLVLGAR